MARNGRRRLADSVNMNGDTDRPAKKYRKPPAKAISRCAVCGSTGHTAGHHDSIGPDGHGPGSPPGFAVEEVVVDDDDDR